MASQLARRIEADIIARGWPVGASLGSEPSLIAEHGVSRSVLREAIRLLEHRHVASMRKGQGGGLVVGAPPRDAIAETVGSYFTLINTPVADLLSAWSVLQLLAIDLAATRLDARTALQIRAAALQPPGHSLSTPLGAAIAEVSGNPALTTFLTSLDIAVGSIAEVASTVRDRPARQRDLAEAVIAGRLVDAAMLVERDSAEFAAQVRVAELTGSIADWRDETAVSKQKLTHRFARHLALDIHRRHLGPNDPLGSERECLDRYEVSRPVFRAALRVLEQTGLVEARRGSSGGLYVASPDAERQAAPVVALLDFIGIDTVDLFTTRRSIDVASVDLATRRLSPAGIAELGQSCLDERSQHLADVHRVSPNLHRLIARLSGNAALHLFAIVLSRAQTERIGGQKRTPEEQANTGARILHTHTDIVDAMVAGDVSLARLLMARDVGAATRYMSPSPVTVDQRVPPHFH